MTAALDVVRYALPCGRALLADAEDWHVVISQPWHAIMARDTFYAQSGEDTTVYLHRLLLQPAPGLVVDHINRNGLDNRRANLRLATHSQNHANRPAPRNNTTGYKGVSRVRSGRFLASITVNYVQRRLGTFTDPWDAAQAYNAAALEAWGEFALLNEHRPQAARDGEYGCPGPSRAVTS